MRLSPKDLQPLARRILEEVEIDNIRLRVVVGAGTNGGPIG
jgi:hypothetical protein